MNRSPRGLKAKDYAKKDDKMSATQPSQDWKVWYKKYLSESNKNRKLINACQNIIKIHRNKVIITCEESCWCWDIERALLESEVK
jgi:hypothetical protein